MNKIDDTRGSGAINPVERASALIPILRERALETSQIARLPEATVADLADARLFELTTPRRYGGLQTDVRTYMDAMVTLGRGDPSVAWVATLVNINNWFTATLFPPEVSEEVFATPGTRIAGVLQPRRCKVRRVEGGYHIDEGLWAFNSGVLHSQWDLLGFSVHDENGQYSHEVLALLPISQVQILDDWDTIGIRGSGSSTVAVRDVFVPDIRTTRADLVGGYKSTQLNDDWLYRSSFVALGQIIISFPALGAGLCALDTFMGLLPSRGITYTAYKKQIEAPITHLQLGEATAKIDAARVLMANAANEIEQTAKAGLVMDPMVSTRIRRDTGFADRLIWEGIDLLADASGGSFASASHPLNRTWRDARVASLHATLVTSTVYELYGRMLCGVGG